MKKSYMNAKRLRIMALGLVLQIILGHWNRQDSADRRESTGGTERRLQRTGKRAGQEVPGGEMQASARSRRRGKFKNHREIGSSSGAAA